jgi:hypothetical protein
MVLATSENANLGGSKVGSQNEAAVDDYRQVTQTLLHSCLTNIRTNEIDRWEVEAIIWCHQQVLHP